MGRWLLVGVAAALLAAITVLAGRGWSPPAAADAATGQTLVVVGSGTVAVVPDQATVNLGVTAGGSTAAAAMAAVAARANDVVAALRTAGVGDADLRTAALTLNPVYARDGSAAITGFQAATAVTVTVHDLGSVGRLLDAAIQAGANQVQGIGFQLADPAAAERQAYAAAIADARARAAALAAAAGLQLGGIRTVREAAGCCPLPLANDRLAAAAAAPPVFGGQQQVTVQVEVTFAVTP
jgi:uncharacterized protein YggE